MDGYTETEQTIHDLSHALEEAQRMVMAQGVTIQALQNRIFHLEMEVVDLMSASLVPPSPVEASPMENPE